MKRYRYYVKPPREVYTALGTGDYASGYKTYAEYNYLNEGVAASIKTRHFETALELTKDFFHRSDVIDFGCADGVFLPSLARHFNHVLAVDQKPEFIKMAEGLAEALHLDNVEVRSNKEVFSNDQLSRGKSYHIMFLLEIIEHIGSREALYESKIAFLKQASSLLDDGGILVISVPKMVGIPFLIQRIGFAAFGLQREKISLINLLKAGILCDTSDLEKNWEGEYAHLGFNHKKLERFMEKEFCIVKKKHLLFQVIYVIKRQPF
jgi:2-polyprenyl-3-methyl-5-hydroxy-6-metoxy-1,4-benzoquinol methylase